MMGGTRLHTPQSIFQHMMGQQNSQSDGRQWLQTPQVPSISIPWSTGLSQQPIRFTGERPPPKYPASSQLKRKFAEPDASANERPTKQFITYEIMSEQLQGLHISPNCINAQNSCPSTSAASEPVQVCANGDESFELDIEGAAMVESGQENAAPRLIISEELKRLQQDPILPSVLMSKLERPSMALVLWEPPNKHLRLVPTLPETRAPRVMEDDNNNTNVDNDSNFNNNNDAIPNLNAMSEDLNEPALEPMDL